MSTSFYFYVEAKNNGKWVCINPIVKGSNGEYQTVPLLWGQSYLRETYENMIETAGGIAVCQKMLRLKFWGSLSHWMI